jgi:uncharacterized membrane protein YfcA
MPDFTDNKDVGCKELGQTVFSYGLALLLLWAIGFVSSNGVPRDDEEEYASLGIDHIFKTPRGIVTVLLIFLGSGLGSACGIGGGGVMVPIFILVGNLHESAAVPSSKATILGGAISSYFLLRPLPDMVFEVVLVLQPLILVGTIIGVNANKVLPNYMIQFGLIIVLTVTGLRSLKKALALSAKEKEKNTIAESLLDAQHGLTPTQNIEMADRNDPAILNEMPPNYPDSYKNLDNENMPPNYPDSYKNVDIGRKKETPDNGNWTASEACFTAWWKQLALLVSWLVLVGSTLMRGGEGLDSILNVDCGSGSWWVITGGTVASFMCLTLLYGGALQKGSKDLDDNTYRNKDDLEEPRKKWTIMYVIWLSSIGMWAGIASGSLGVGGGMILGTTNSLDTTTNPSTHNHRPRPQTTNTNHHHNY